MMQRFEPERAGRFRVWIAGRGRQEENSCQESLDIVAMEPAEEGTFSSPQAACYVQAFNRAAAAAGRNIRAVAVPVAIRHLGEPRRGEPLRWPAEADENAAKENARR